MMKTKHLHHSLQHVNHHFWPCGTNRNLIICNEIVGSQRSPNQSDILRFQSYSTVHLQYKTLTCTCELRLCSSHILRLRGGFFCYKFVILVVVLNPVASCSYLLSVLDVVTCILSMKELEVQGKTILYERQRVQFYRPNAYFKSPFSPNSTNLPVCFSLVLI